MTFARNDTASIVKYDMQRTNHTEDELKKKSTDEMITESKLLPCEFNRDELFSFVVLNDAQLAGDLKTRNRAGNLTAQDLKDSFASHVHSWYYYSNQSPVLMFANNEWRDKHDFKENLVLISIDDLEPKYSVLRPFMGVLLDVDLIMVNQIMFTFRRESGYLVNNSTSEQWLWHERQFKSTLMNQKFDMEDDPFLMFCLMLVTKTIRLIAALIGFMLLSFVNGMVVRVALMCSNVVIFPLLAMMELCSGQPINNL